MLIQLALMEGGGGHLWPSVLHGVPSILHENVNAAVQERMPNFRNWLRPAILVSPFACLPAPCSLAIIYRSCDICWSP